MHFSNFFSSEYIGFVGYETYDKLIWISVEDFRNKN